MKKLKIPYDFEIKDYQKALLETLKFPKELLFFIPRRAGRTIITEKYLEDISKMKGKKE